MIRFGSMLAALLALSSVASAQCEQSLERTPLRFSADAQEVVIEVIERDSCFPDGVSGHRMEIRRTSDLGLIQRVELIRGERDWSDPTTWEDRDGHEVDVEITKRRSGFLRDHLRRFSVRAVRQQVEWDASRLVAAGTAWAVPSAIFSLVSPYAASLPLVEVWTPASRALQVAVGTVDHAGRDRLVVLRS